VLWRRCVNDGEKSFKTLTRDVSAMSAVAADTERVGADERELIALASFPWLRFPQTVFTTGKLF
jgi:hypothetical protein